MTSGAAAVLILVAVALMILSGVEKKQLVFGLERRCRRCHRPVAYCSCPQRRQAPR